MGQHEGSLKDCSHGQGGVLLELGVLLVWQSPTTCLVHLVQIMF